MSIHEAFAHHTLSCCAVATCDDLGLASLNLTPLGCVVGYGDSCHDIAPGDASVPFPKR